MPWSLASAVILSLVIQGFSFNARLPYIFNKHKVMTEAGAGKYFNIIQLVGEKLEEMAAEHEKGIVYSTVPVGANVNKDTQLAVKFPAEGVSPTSSRQGHTFTYDAYFLAEPSEDGKQTVMIDILSATDGKTTHGRGQLVPVLEAGTTKANSLSLNACGKSYPINGLRAFVKADNSNPMKGNKIVSACIIIEVPADVSRNAELKVE